MKTCWMKLPSFTEVAHRLRDRFDGASKVIASNDGNSFMTEGLSIKPPTKQDLVYTDESPDFCRPNKQTGSLGEKLFQTPTTPQFTKLNLLAFHPQEFTIANATTRQMAKTAATSYAATMDFSAV